MMLVTEKSRITVFSWSNWPPSSQGWAVLSLTLPYSANQKWVRAWLEIKLAMAIKHQCPHIKRSELWLFFFFARNRQNTLQLISCKMASNNWHWGRVHIALNTQRPLFGQVLPWQFKTIFCTRRNGHFTIAKTGNINNSLSPLNIN